MTAKRAETYANALELGLADYAWQDVPIGAWRARLDFKAWGKGSGLSLICCFTALDSGAKYRLTAYPGAPKDRRYAPRDRGIDFSEPGIEGRVYDVGIAVSRNGTPAWHTAHLVGSEAAATSA
jgi:hypothetical protein